MFFRVSLLMAVVVLPACAADEAWVVDFGGVKADSAEALKAWAEGKGGEVAGTPSVVLEAGKGGSKVPTLRMEQPGDGLLLANAAPGIDLREFGLSARLFIERFGWGKAGGAVLGLMRGKANDFILGLYADKWAKKRSPVVNLGYATVVDEEAFAATNPLPMGEWFDLRVSALGGVRWRLEVNGKVVFEGDLPEAQRPYFKSESRWLRVGGPFAGMAQDVRVGPSTP